MQEDDTKIPMRLEALPIQDTNIGVQHIRLQLESSHMELQSLKIGEEAQPEVCTKVWFLKCKGHRHDKDHCPIYQNYLIGVGGGLFPKGQKTLLGRA